MQPTRQMKRHLQAADRRMLPGIAVSWRAWEGKGFTVRTHLIISNCGRGRPGDR